MASMHALHKIPAHCARPSLAPGRLGAFAVAPGEFLDIEPDIFAVIVGVNGAEAKRLAADLEELGIRELPLKDRIVAVADHAAPAPTVAIAGSQKRWRDFFRAHGIRTFDAGAGVSHLVLCEQGVVRPGMAAIAIDSHAPTMGAIGMYATSLGGGRLTLYAIGRYVIQIPHVTLVRASGTLAPGLSGRDASLYVNGKLGQRGAYSNAVEFAGPFIDKLSMDRRFTFANMGTEMGAVTSYIQPEGGNGGCLGTPGGIDMKLTGKIWKFPQDDINTGLIRKQMYNHLPPREQGKYCMESLDPQFSSKVKPGDFIVAGTNFGCGSSTPARYSIVALGITAVIAESFAPLFFSNCAGGALWPVACPGILGLVATGDTIDLDTDSFVVRNLATGKTL